jgi:hypothetical protein
MVTEPQWWIETVDEPWGRLHYIETRYLDLYIGFLSIPGEPVTAFIDGIHLQETTSTWRVDYNAAHTVTGSFDQYFGSLALRLTTNLTEEIRRGAALTVAIPDEPTIVMVLDSAHADI